MCKILILMVVLALSGCLEKRSQELIISGNSAKKHKEADLVPESKAVSHNDTVILKLESAESHEGDTGTTGVDIVTYEFTHSVNQEVCLEKHADINYQLVIKDNDGNEIIKVEDGECETVNISEGLYHFHISHSSFVRLPGSNSAVFIRPYAETTHCEDYKSAATDQTVPEESVELKTLNRCTDNKYLACTVPASYKDLSADCPIEGPWTCSNYAECSSRDPDEAENCKKYFYKNCDEIASVCINFWKENGNLHDRASIWRKCFNGFVEQYSSTVYSDLADSVIFESYDKYTEEYCNGPVVRDCNSKWNTNSLKPEKCSGFVKYIKYSDLDLKQGEAAIQQRSYMHIGRNNPDPQPEEIVMVINGRCDGVMRRTGSVIAGPYTQVILYPYENLKGKPFFLENLTENPKELQFPKMKRPFLMKGDPTYSAMIDSETASLTVMAVTGKSADLCRIKDVGVVCDSPTKWDILPKLTGEVAIVKKVDERINAGTNCAAVYLFDYRCDDLSKLGLKNYGPDMDVPQTVSKVIMPDSDTILRTFQNTNFAGSVKVSQGSPSVPSTVYLDSEKFESAHAYKLPDYNHAILISLRKCCGCDLENVNFSGDDLSNTVLVGSNMKNASFTGVDLTGSDLRDTSLVNTRFSSVKLGDNYFGCTDLSNVDMSDPSDSSKSMTTVSGSCNWDTSSTYNGITVSCDESKTNLMSAKIPVQILPEKSWKTINLQKATLLDKVDGYDLSGIDLSDSDFTDLKAGGKVMNMQGANLNGSNLTNADFSSIDFSPLINDKTAQYSNFSNTRIGGTSFANADLEGADFKNVSVNGVSASVNFSYALMMNTVLADADLGRADFSYAYFFSKFRENVTTQKKAKAENIIAQDGIFTGSFMSNMTFANVTFKNCNFNAAQLVGTTFSSGDLSNSKFSDAYLQGADTTGALLTDASFSGAYLSLKDGYWHYSSDDAECSDIRINYNKTKLGDTSSVICPNGEKGPCDTEEKLSRKDKKTVEPPCVDGDEDIFGDTDCITHEYLEKNTIPKCDESNEDVMQCGCLIEGE